MEFGKQVENLKGTKKAELLIVILPIFLSDISSNSRGGLSSREKMTGSSLALVLVSRLSRFMLATSCSDALSIQGFG
jgi:hypothetical protein